jgi:hypothetical protein
MGRKEHWVSDDFLDKVIGYFKATPTSLQKMFDDMGLRTGATWFYESQHIEDTGYAVVFRDFQNGNQHILMMDVYDNADHHVHATWNEFMDEFRFAYEARMRRQCVRMPEICKSATDLAQIQQDIGDLKSQLQKLQAKARSRSRAKR